jgi:actin-related protein
MALVLPTALPQPLLSTILDTLFNGFQPPTISLMSAPVLATVAAGLRAALVVDIGWAETVITGIYEYREIHCRRTIRASKLLCREMLNLLGAAVLGLRQTEQDNTKDHDEKEYQKVVSFEECEDVVARVAWCRHSENMSTEPKMPATLPAVKEEEELELSMQGLDISAPSTDSVSIALSSTQPPVTLKLPFSQLSQPCERAFLADGINARDLDDEELPINLLVYQTLLNLPVDVRSVCMSRIIFTGGGSTIPGLKNRILNDVQNLIGERDWNPVQGRAVEQLRQNSKPVSNRPRQGNSGPIELIGTTEDNPQPSSNAAFEDQESDPIDEKLQREASKGKRLTVQGTLRAVDSLGAWSGASLLSQLKIPSVSVVDKEQWLQAGPAGASRQGEESKTNQRQSMGGAGLRAAASDRTSWTFGPWG